nr:MAG TPA: hypothetical protein [Caudoviricetes sp.]
MSNKQVNLYHTKNYQGTITVVSELTYSPWLKPGALRHFR